MHELAYDMCAVSTRNPSWKELFTSLRYVT
jgi:hypothetical protein